MPLMEIKILPLGTAQASVSSPIARAVSILRKEKGVRYRLTSMGTIVEAKSTAMLLRVARRMHRATFGKDVVRVLTFIELDERRDKKMSMADKLHSLRRRLAER